MSVSQVYGKVVLVPNLFDRKERRLCETEEEYTEMIYGYKYMTEVISDTEQYIKPVFDVDKYDNDIDIDSEINHISKLFPDKTINYAKREPREHNGKMKYSYRIYVNGVGMKWANMPRVLEVLKLDQSKGYDTGIYHKSGLLHTPFTSQKAGKTPNTWIDVPELTPINCSIFDCCASYVLEDYDTSLSDTYDMLRAKETKKKDDTNSNNSDETESKKKKKDTSFIESKLNGIIEHLDIHRSDDYTEWTKVCWALIGISKKEELKRRFCEDMIHLFSKKSKKYDGDEVDDKFDKCWDTNNNNTLGWPHLLNCLKADDIDYYEKINTPTYVSFKKDFEEKNCKILNPPSVVTIDREGSMILNTLGDAKLRFQHVNVVVKNKKDEWEKKCFIDIWLKDGTLRKYDKMVFRPPPLTSQSYDFNTWEDFKIKEVVNTPTDDRDYFKEYCEYAKNLFGDENVSNFILARYAHRLQKPAYRTHLCVIIYGNEGDGKNMLLTPIYKIFGKYALQLDDASKLYEKHSELENKKLLILINEAGGDTNFKNADTLKSRITDPELWVNPKGIKAYCVENRCDYDMLTNNRNVVKINDSSHRRFLQTETTQYYSGNTVFFNDFLANIVENEVALRQIYDGLMAFDVKKYVPSGNFQVDKPHTQIMDEVKEQNKDKVMCFIEDMVKMYNGTTNVVIYTNNELFDKWNKWLFDTKVKLDYNNRQFGIKFGDMCKKFINKGSEELIGRNPKKSTNTFKYDLLRTLFRLDGID